MKHFFGTLAILFLLIQLSYAKNHPVTVKDGFFYLNGVKFFMKGLGIENVRPGMGIDTPETLTAKWFSYDLKRMKAAGYNTVRTWGAQTEEQLASVDGLGMKIMMGIWIPNHADFTEPGFIEKELEYVDSVLSYSKNHDEIIAYLIMNEPNTEDIVRDYATTQKLWTIITNEIHTLHPNTPVGISAYPNTAYLDMSMFDFIGYNIHPNTNTAMKHCFDYPAYVRFLRDVHGYDKPFIVTEFGVSVSPLADNSWIDGNTQEERQTNGLLYMYRSMLDAGVSGSNVFINADGWYFAGNPKVHDNAASEWAGLIEYQSVSDMIGTPRPAWYALQEYNRAIVTSPKNSEVYVNKLPIEIFASDTVDYFTITMDEEELYSEFISNRYFNDTLTIPAEGFDDKTLYFTFYDASNNVVKQEEITILLTNTPIQLPQLTITSDQQFFDGSKNIDLTYTYKHNARFSVSNKLYYASEPIIDYDYAQGAYTETFRTGNYAFSKTYGSHFYPVDIMCWNNRSVIVFSAGTDISFGKFKKRITGNLIMWRDSSYTTIPARIEAEEYQHMSGVLPGVTTDNNGDWHIDSFDPGDWMSYYLNATETKEYPVTFRYASSTSVTLTIKDGETDHTVTLPSSGGLTQWTSYSTVLPLTRGNHKLRFETDNSNLYLNWFEFSWPTDVTAYSMGDCFLNVYPNPITGDVIHLEIPEKMTGQPLKVELFDASGQIVFTQEIVSSEPKISLDIRSARLRKVIYLLRATTESDCKSKSVVVE